MQKQRAETTAVTGEDIKKIGNRLPDCACAYKIVALKGKPIERVFWQFLTPENLSKSNKVIRY
jgi:hypothetical protein